MGDLVGVVRLRKGGGEIMRLELASGVRTLVWAMSFRG